MLVSLNSQKTVYDYSERFTGFIDNSKIKLDAQKDNTNDYYSLHKTESSCPDVIPTLLKEAYIDQIAYPVFTINSENYKLLRTQIDLYKKYNELYNAGEIKNAKNCVLKSGFKTFEELENHALTFTAPMIDIDEKYDQFVKRLEDHELLNYDASLIARQNSANMLEQGVYADAITECVEATLTKLETSKMVSENIKYMMNEVAAKIETTEQAISSLETEKKEIEDRLTVSSEQLVSLQNEYNALVAERDDVQLEKEGLDAEYNEMKAKEDEGEEVDTAVMDELAGKIDTLTRKLNSLNEEINAYTASIQSSLETIEFIKKEHNTTVSKLEDQNQNLLKHRDEQAGNEDIMNSYDREIHLLERTLVVQNNLKDTMTKIQEDATANKEKTAKEFQAADELKKVNEEFLSNLRSLGEE